MLLWAIILIVAGTLAGLFAPILFSLTFVGLILLVVALVRGRQGARDAAPPNRPE